MNGWKKPCEAHGTHYDQHSWFMTREEQEELEAQGHYIEEMGDPVVSCPGGTRVTETEILSAAKAINNKWHQEPT